MSYPDIPTLRRSIELFPASTGDIYLLRTDGAGDVVIRQAGRLERALLTFLAEGGRHRGRLLDDLRLAGVDIDEPSLTAVLHQLADLGLLEDRSRLGLGRMDPSELERYDRQLAYFAETATDELDEFDMQVRLRDATVVVIGVGGLGSWALAGLACAGLGQLVGVDDDVIEPSNLNRQILYRASDIGRQKVAVAAERIRAFDPGLRFEAVCERIQSAADVARLIEKADFVVGTADWPPHDIDRWIDSACVDRGVPHVSAGQFPPLVRVGPTYMPGRTACLECQEARIRREFALYDELVEHRKRTPATAATLGAPSALIGSLIAMEAVHHLTGICPPATLGRALIFDLRTFSARWEEIDRDPSCPRCKAPGHRTRSPIAATATPP